jgi:RNA polymerase sigma-70 factor (ECF subfamily)
MKGFEQYSDLELSVMLNSTDQSKAKAAFDEVYRRYSKLIYTYCLKILRDEENAKDAFQDTFVKFLNNISKKDGIEIENLKAYLMKIAHNVCMDKVDEIKKMPEPLDQTVGQYYRQKFERKEEKEIIDAALDKLPFILKETLMLKEYLNYNYDEIGEILDMSRGAVASNIHRAKEKLREILAPYFKEYVKKEKEKKNE